MDIQTSPDAKTAAQKAATALSEAVASYKDQPVLFLCSGGSSLGVLPLIKTDIFGANTTIGMTDERFSTDPAINNFLQLSQVQFYKDITARGAAHFDGVPQNGEELEAMGKRYDAFLKTWHKDHENGKIVVLLGIGPDGHTAGMMPYPEDERAFGFLFEDGDVWAVGYDAGNKNQYPKRVTITMPVLRRTDMVVTYACGENKKNALTQALTAGEFYKLPARIMRDLPHCLLCTDQEVGKVKL